MEKLLSEFREFPANVRAEIVDRVFGASGKTHPGGSWIYEIAKVLETADKTIRAQPDETALDESCQRFTQSVFRAMEENGIQSLERERLEDAGERISELFFRFLEIPEKDTFVSLKSEFLALSSELRDHLLRKLTDADDVPEPIGNSLLTRFSHVLADLIFSEKST